MKYMQRHSVVLLVVQTVPVVVIVMYLNFNSDYLMRSYLLFKIESKGCHHSPSVLKQLLYKV